MEQMTFGQIVMYLNEGLKFYKRDSAEVPAKKSNSLIGASAEEIRRKREELRRQYGSNVEGL